MVREWEGWFSQGRLPAGVLRAEQRDCLFAGADGMRRSQVLPPEHHWHDHSPLPDPTTGRAVRGPIDEVSTGSALPPCHCSWCRSPFHDRDGPRAPPQQGRLEELEDATDEDDRRARGRVESLIRGRAAIGGGRRTRGPTCRGRRGGSRTSRGRSRRRAGRRGGATGQAVGTTTTGYPLPRWLASATAAAIRAATRRAAPIRRASRPAGSGGPRPGSRCRSTGARPHRTDRR